jgi:hypothetical protein
MVNLDEYRRKKDREALLRLAKQWKRLTARPEITGSVPEARVVHKTGGSR